MYQDFDCILVDNNINPWHIEDLLGIEIIRITYNVISLILFSLVVKFENLSRISPWRIYKIMILFLLHMGYEFKQNL